MKQATALLAGITLIIAATPVAAREPVALPLPTGMTAGAPAMSVPAMHEGLPVESTRSRWRDRFAGFSLFGGSGSDCEPYDPVKVKPQWCVDCAPAFRNPLPPLPAGVTKAAAPAVAVAHEPACREHDGHCWERLKSWLCYRQTPVHLPCTPTPRYPPLFTLFPCKEHCGEVGAGCDISRKGVLHGKRAAAGCTTCPTPAEAILPGYRLAAPQAPVQPTVAPPALTTSHYRQASWQKPASR